MAAWKAAAARCAGASHERDDGIHEQCRRMFPKGEMCGVGGNKSVRIRIRSCHVTLKGKKYRKCFGGQGVVESCSAGGDNG